MNVAGFRKIYEFCFENNLNNINSNQIFYSAENLEEKRQRIEKARIEAGANCRVEIEGLNIVEVIEDARLHFVKFETRQIEKCLDYVRDILLSTEDTIEVVCIVYSK